MGDRHALFRGLSADRGDGRARPRDIALRADETGRPHRSAHRRAGACGGPVAPGQRAGHALQPGRVPDQAAPWRADPRAANDSGTPERGIRQTRRRAPQHLPQFAASAGRQAQDEGRPAAAFRRPDHRRRGLCGERGHRPARRPVCRRRAARRGARAAPADHGPGRAADPHHRRSGRSDLPADERQFRSVPALGRAPPRARAKTGLLH